MVPRGVLGKRAKLATPDSLTEVGRPIVQRKDAVQRLRFFSQLFSLLVNIWIAVEFYLFVRYLENPDSVAAVNRPAGVEGWLPIGALVSLKHWWETSEINTVHPAGLVIFIVIMLTAWLFKKGFCSWVCPVGFASQVLGDIFDKLWRRRLRPPAWLDYPLRSLKYLLAGAFLWSIVVAMNAYDIESFLYSDYNRVADILMLRFFTHISALALWVIVGLFALSLVIRGFWCRYLCPYGALLGLLGLISPTRIRRDALACINCSSCSLVCPSFIDVERVSAVHSDECTGCLACIDSCPAPSALNLYPASTKTRLSPKAWAMMLVLMFWGILIVFKTVGPWQNSITTKEYIELMPGIQRGIYTHPR